MIRFFRIVLLLALSLWVVFGLGTIGHAHSGIVDGYGCHRARDKVTYHCHQGEFAGRTFKSREDFLRQLRGGKAEQLCPKKNQPQVEKKIDTGVMLVTKQYLVSPEVKTLLHPPLDQYLK